MARDRSRALRITLDALAAVCVAALIFGLFYLAGILEFLATEAKSR